jgi:predicted porin
MKKTLIAVAVLAASGAAVAQSTVTLYGIADVYARYSTTDLGKGAGSLAKSEIGSGGINTSRWGLKGSEDLGGGLKANFRLEEGFAMDTGAGQKKDFALAPQAFARESWVGFSGGFGEVKLGKAFTPFDDVLGVSDGMFHAVSMSPMRVAFASENYRDTISNTIYYATPNFSGLAAAASYSASEGDATRARVEAFNVTYGSGPVAMQFAYQEENVALATAGGIAGTTANNGTYAVLGGSYDFGVAKAKATYAKVTNKAWGGGAAGENIDGNNTKEWQIGVDVPMGQALTLSADYAKSDDNNATGANPTQKRDGFGMAAKYVLSKRTFLYGGFSVNTASQVVTGSTTGDWKKNIVELGMNHKF